MNTKNLKAYAPKARTQFIEAVKKRAAQFGIYEGEDGKVRIEEVRVEGGAAIIEGRAFTRKEGEQRKRLESKVVERGYDMFIREMAYTWFNRLAALRYMEIHDYFEHGFRVLSHPTNSDSLPEILSHASDVADSLELDKGHIIELQLAGDKEEELYRELLLGQCHHLYKIMPFMFEAIDDATELLLPSNLTKTDSILKGLINDIPEEDWQEIEVIGWLYQFYISEHKDAVIGKVVKSEDIPAATQLFTPNWIVKYLVQNSVGRQWLATYPDSELKGKMEYYIEPAEQSDEVIEQLKAITPTSIDPEEIKVLDPACGSGHILVEVYEVLREIYLERGYRLREIPELILTKNIYGLDIDDRAAQLAGFALMMKAREDDRRIFQRVEDGDVSLNVFSMQSTEQLDIPKLWKALDLEGNQQTGATGGLFDTSEEFVQPTGIYKEYFELLQMLKLAFVQAKTLGSLIQINHAYLDGLIALKEKINEKILGSDPAAKQASYEVISIIRQAVCLAQRYDSVIANPPYMGSRTGMNDVIKGFAEKNFPESKGDTFSLFITRSYDQVKDCGKVSMVTLDSWLTLSTYEQFREKLLYQNQIESLIHAPYEGKKPTAMGINFGITSFVLTKQHTQTKGNFLKVRYLDLTEEGSPNRDLKEIVNFELNSKSFLEVPASSIVYSLSEEGIETVSNSVQVSDFAEGREGMATADNDRFIRHWFEIDFSKILFDCSDNKQALESGKKWFPYIKGGEFNKWFGNLGLVVNWKNDGQEVRNNINPVTGKVRSHNYNGEYAFLEGMTWTSMSSKGPSARFVPAGYMFDAKGPMLYCDKQDILNTMSLINSKVGEFFLKALSTTKDFKIGQILSLPISNELKGCSFISGTSLKLIDISKKFDELDESQWFFCPSELVKTTESKKVQTQFLSVIQSYSELYKKAKDLEKEINEYLIKLYGLEKELSSDFDEEKFTFFSPDESSLTCSLLSVAIGNMMGRFSIDRRDLQYVQSNNAGFSQLVSDGAFNTFPADDDAIIPLASEEWLFDDDATTRFKEFVKTVWSDEHLSENLEFVAESLCQYALKPKKGENAMDTIRRYFSTQFFKDHCKTYKKRPIYWLFSSGKEKAFECLVYLHRYNEGTLSRMRTEYVTPLMGKYDAQHTLLSEQKVKASGGEVRRIEKDLKSLEKKQAELRIFDEQLKHYAEKRITLDLDDGVKANYGKFGNLLADVKAIHGKVVK